MTRYRALLFGQPLGPWRATGGLAAEDAIAAGEASRDQFSGKTYPSPGVKIEKDDGEAPMTPDQERWAEALAVFSSHGNRSEAFIAERLAALADDPAGRTRWRLILDRVRQVQAAAARAAGGVCLIPLDSGKNACAVNRDRLLKLNR